MGKKVVCIFLIIVNTICLSGCWGYKEINELPIVIGAAIDKANRDEYLLTVEVLRTSEVTSGTKEANTILLQTTGKTIFDALRNLTVKNGKFLYWANMKVVLISKEIAEEDIISVLDLLHRDIEVRSEARVIVAKGKASDIFKENKGEEASFRILDVMENSSRFSKIYPLKIYEVVDIVLLKGRSLVLPMLSPKDIYSQNKDIELESAVFKENKMIGTLLGDEVQTYRLLLNEEEGGIRVENSLKYYEAKISYEIEKSRTKIKPLLKNGKIQMDIDIKTDAFIAEVMNYKMDFMKEDVRNYMKEQLEETIKGDCIEFILKMQKDLNSDILGFGELVKNKYPKLWKKQEEDWNRILTDISVNVKVKVNFKGSALFSSMEE